MSKREKVWTRVHEISQMSIYWEAYGGKHLKKRFVLSLELDNIEEWAKVNNLTLNRGKSTEIVIIDRKRSAMASSHHRCQTYTEYLLSRYLVSPSLTNCLLTTMSAILSASVHRLYMHWQYCMRMACVTRRYKQSSGQSSSPGCCTPAAPGGDSHRPPTDNE